MPDEKRITKENELAKLWHNVNYQKCMRRGYHNFKEYIDPKLGGFIKCLDCGFEFECEEDEDW